MKENKGQLAAATGFANESRLLGALLSRGYNASRVDLPLSSYDIIMELNAQSNVRIQVKTVGFAGSVSFTGGLRGGVDRTYKAGIKEYTQSTKTSDAVVGVKVKKENGDSNVDFYIIPTLYIETLEQKSLSINKIPQAKNNWALLEHCKDRAFVTQVFW